MRELPQAYVGKVGGELPKWREVKFDEDATDDDEQLAQTPADVISMLGFDPADEDDEAEDAIANDEAILSFRRAPALAFDRATVRRIDQDGRMHVELTNISKATVNGYLGSEIPGCDELGLDPKRIYQLLRDPAELEKGAATFNAIPLLSKHIPVSAQDHQPGIVVGATGTDAVFEAPYLKNSLVVWAADAVQGIESDEKRELSCAYRYVPVMEPGVFQGMRFDGRMTEIVGNHVALVVTGRAGPDVIVGDSQLKKEDGMKSKPLSRHAVLAKGALFGSVTPMLAADAKLDLNAILTGVTAANWNVKKAGIAHAIRPKLAADADIADVVQLLDKLNPDGAAKDDDDDMADAIDADPAEGVHAMLRGKISDEDLAAVGAKIKELMTPAVDAEPMVAVDPDDASLTAKPGDKPAPAMDSSAVSKIVAKAVEAGKAEVMRQTREAAEAREVVRPYVGSVAVALDSGEAVYKAALGILGVKTEGIHPSALRAVLEAHQKPGQARRIAQDAVPATGFAARFPNLATK